MKITKIETIPIRLPTRRVHQWASLTTPIGVYVIIKLLTDEGLVGLGEAPVLKDWGGDHGKYFGETPQTTAHIINDILAPALNGQDPSRFETIHALMDKAVKGYPYCKAAIDAALYDVVGKALNVPAYQLLGGLFRERIPIAHSLGLMEIEKAVEETLQAKAEGVKTIKLKGVVSKLDWANPHAHVYTQFLLTHSRCLKSLGRLCPGNTTSRACGGGSMLPTGQPGFLKPRMPLLRPACHVAAFGSIFAYHP